MTIAYWFLAAPLAAFYLYAGALKATRDRDRLRPIAVHLTGGDRRVALNAGLLAAAAAVTWPAAAGM
ncbi:hypothetical protein [Kitasatospora sp. NPDC088779]|uniref:hypothetical protein n=1 Tax=Kitasatospora sp. NPDC088779 TaxID=3154964 RepID=UPI0034333712